MKIGLAGAGGTGKGTLGEKLAKHYDFVFLPSHIEETGRSFGMTSYRDGYDQMKAYAFQHAIMYGQIYQERAIEIAKLNMIAERTTLDYIPYFLQRRFPLGTHKKYLDMARNWAKTYDAIIYLPIDFKAQDAKEKSWKERDPKCQMNTDCIIKIEIEKSKVPFIEVRGTVEERLSQVTSWIATLGEKAG